MQITWQGTLARSTEFTGLAENSAELVKQESCGWYDITGLPKTWTVQIMRYRMSKGEVGNFFSSCGSQRYFFYSQTRVATFSWHYVNLFPFFPGLARAFSTLGPDFRFYTGLKRSFSCLRPALLFLSGIMLTFFHSFLVWHALFLLRDPIFTSLWVWFALFLLRDPILLLCGSGTRFFSFGTRVWLLTRSEMFFFLLRLRLTLPVVLGLRIFFLSVPNSSLFHDSSHIFQHCFIPFSHLSGILIIVKRKSPLTQFLFHNMAGKYPTSYRLLLLFIKW